MQSQLCPRGKSSGGCTRSVCTLIISWSAHTRQSALVEIFTDGPDLCRPTSSRASSFPPMPPSSPHQIRSVLVVSTSNHCFPRCQQSNQDTSSVPQTPFNGCRLSGIAPRHACFILSFCRLVQLPHSKAFSCGQICRACDPQSRQQSNLLSLQHMSACNTCSCS